MSAEQVKNMAASVDSNGLRALPAGENSEWPLGKKASQMVHGNKVDGIIGIPGTLRRIVLKVIVQQALSTP